MGRDELKVRLCGVRFFFFLKDVFVNWRTGGLSDCSILRRNYNIVCNIIGDARNWLRLFVC